MNGLQWGTPKAYDSSQVLNTLRIAVPRADDAVFLRLHRFAPMGEWPVRKAGRTSIRVCSNSPAYALNSVAPVSNRSICYV